MQPSDTRLQRPSQIALSRSRFIKLAVSTLLPFAALPKPAGAASSSDQAQNGGASGTNDDAASDRMGTILVSQFGLVKIHSYLSPEIGRASCRERV